MKKRLKQAFSPSRLASEAMELQALVREASSKLSNILSLAAENKLQVRLAGLEDSPLMENLQKIANRISTGVITASLILASAMLMRVEGGRGCLDIRYWQPRCSLSRRHWALPW